MFESLTLHGQSGILLRLGLIRNWHKWTFPRSVQGRSGVTLPNAVWSSRHLFYKLRCFARSALIVQIQRAAGEDCTCCAQFTSFLMLILTTFSEFSFLVSPGGQKYRSRELKSNTDANILFTMNITYENDQLLINSEVWGIIFTKHMCK